MKIAKRVLIAIIAVLCVAAPAEAQFRWGIKAGLNINKVDLNAGSANLKGENRAGWCAGLMTEFTVPIVNLGFDASVLYSHRSIADAEDYSNDYIDIPINLKYKLGLPVVGNIITPYFFTGPDFAFLCSKKAINAAWENKSVDVSWNLGLGVQLVNHLQISAQYGWDMSKVAKVSGGTAKLNGWLVSAAYLF